MRMADDDRTYQSRSDASRDGGSQGRPRSSSRSRIQVESQTRARSSQGRTQTRAQGTQAYSQTRSRAQRSSGGSQRGGSQRGRSSAPQRYSDSEILRNRIIAIAALVVMIVIIVSFVSCVAGAIFGGGDKKQETASDSAAATQTQASSQAASASTSASSSSDPATRTGSETGVEDRWVDTGYFTTGDDELDRLVKEFCDEHSDPNLSAAENAKKVYEQAVWREYVEDGENQEPVGPNWDIEYAKQSFRKGTGNCFEFAACDEFILKYFGYTDVYAEPCFVLMQSGGYGDHGLTFVTDFDGRKCLCDSSLGANGWLLDADNYTVKLMNVGQDESERNVANFEEVVDAKWLQA